MNRSYETTILFSNSFTYIVCSNGLGRIFRFFYHSCFRELIISRFHYGLLDFRIGLLLFYILGLLLLKYTLLRLKRIEIDDNHLYAYNYFKSFRYDHDSVETINDLDFLLFHLGKITLKEKGSFGKHLYFLQSKQKFRSFLPQVPRLYEKLVQKKEEPEQSE